MLRADARAYFFLLSAAAALGVLFSNAGPAAAATPKPATYTVVIEGVRFDPQVLTVNVVFWINHDPFPHTATAQGGSLTPTRLRRGAPGNTPHEKRVCSLTPARCIPPCWGHCVWNRLPGKE